MADKFSDRFPPSVTATKLYERTSAKGNPYLTGRWGGLRVALLKTSEQDSEGHRSTALLVRVLRSTHARTTKFRSENMYSAHHQVIAD